MSALEPLRSHTSVVGRIANQARSRYIEAEQAPLRIQALGALQVSVGDRTVPSDAWSAAAKRLFAYLLAEPLDWIPKERIMEALWPGKSVDKGRASLRNALHVLRMILQPDLDPLACSRYVLSQGEDIRLHLPAGSSYDVREFEDGIEHAREIAADGTDRAVEALRSTLPLYRGDFLEAIPYEDFLRDKRDELHDLWLDGSRLLVGLLGEASRWKETVAQATQALRRSPGDDPLTYHLLRGLLKTGMRAAAEEEFRKYERFVSADAARRPMRRIIQLMTRE